MSEEITEAARLLDVRPPEEEFRALVEARMETLAKLGRAGVGAAEGGPAAPGRLEVYADALFRGLAYLREASPLP